MIKMYASEQLVHLKNNNIRYLYDDIYWIYKQHTASVFELVWLCRKYDLYKIINTKNKILYQDKKFKL